MKKITLTLAISLITSLAYSQTKVINSEREYLNHSIWSQVFRDFEVQVTIPIITPWIVGFGSFSYINNNISNKNILKEYDIFSKKDLIFREITNNINTSFLNFIPNDSTMRVRTMYKNLVLCTYDISRTDTTAIVDFNTPKKTNREVIIFDKNSNLLTYDCFTSSNSMSIAKHLLSDTLSVYITSYLENTQDLIEKRQFKNRLITRKTVYKKDKYSLKQTFVSDVIYKYDDNLALTETLNLNKKGKVTDSISNYYNNGRLMFLSHKGSNITERGISYNYLGNDTVSKEIKINDEHRSITYITSANKLCKIIFKDVMLSKSNTFVFEYNTQGLLITLSKFKSANWGDIDGIPEGQFMFGYDEKMNIKNIKMINNNGTVMKEINYEYDYL
ncbi:MAG: hypothetical protein VB102_05140 [Paludibacter sp.]|nr:hypothetical protein [Paludibacter sp.]